MAEPLTTNAASVYEKFIKLNVKEMGRSIKTGIRKGLMYIRNRARSNFRSLFPSGTKANPKYNDKLIDGIRATKVKDKGGVMEGYVLITSNRRTGSGSYRLVFLEGGTVQRYTKKGSNRGSIQASRFFEQTINTESENYNAVMVSEIDKAVDKINKANLK